MNLTEFKFKQGKHFSRPFINPILHPSTNKVSAYVMFNENSIYTCKDQMDWNKLMGISWGFSFNKNAVMWAYRWNTEINSFQLSPYVNYQENVENKMFFLDDNHKLFKPQLNTLYLLQIEKLIHKTQFFIRERLYNNTFFPRWTYETNLPVNTNSILVTRRRPYHGGNTTPNNDYSVYMGYL
jgi:hypothetical protein